jgi:hypothetical protein
MSKIIEVRNELQHKEFAQKDNGESNDDQHFGLVSSEIFKKTTLKYGLDSLRDEMKVN